MGILLVLEDDCVAVKGLLVKTVGVEHVGQVVEHVEGQVNIDLVERALSLTELTNLLFLRGGFLSLSLSIIQVLFNFGSGGLFKEAVDFLFNLFKVLLFALFFLFLDDGRLLVGEDTFSIWLRFESGGGVGFHGGTETLLTGSNGLTAGSDSATLVA